MKKALKWTGISFGILIAISGITVGIVLHLLTPQRLTPIVNKYATELLDAKVNFDSIRLSVWEEFPMLSVELMGGEIISRALKNDTAFLDVHPAEADTLVRFKRFMVSLNVMDLLQAKINIRRIRLSQPDIYGYVSPSGKANWEIYTAAPDTVEKESAPLDLNIDRLTIRGPAKLHYRSCPDSMNINATVGRLSVRGNLTLDMDKLDVERFACANINADAHIEKGDIKAALQLDTLAIENIEPQREYKLKMEALASAAMDGQKYCENLPLKLNGNLKLNPDNRNFFGFKEFALGIAALPEIKLNGDIELAEGNLNSDLDCRIDALPVQALLNLVPKGMVGDLQKIHTNVKFDLHTAVKGTYKFDEKGKLPSIDIDFRIPKGEITYNDTLSKIDNIAIDASFHYDPTVPKNTGIKVRNIDIEAFAVKLNGNVDVRNILNDPNVTLDLEGSANLRELMNFIPVDLGVTTRGNLSFNAKGSFLASRLNAVDFGKNDLVVGFNANRLRVRIPKDSINILMENTHLELNTAHQQASRRTGAVRRRMSVSFTSDTARVRLPNRETIAMSKAHLFMSTSDAIMSNDTGAIVPMSGNITAASLEYSGTNSTTARLRELTSRVSYRPSRENRRLPVIRFNIEAKRLNMVSAGNRASVREASIELKATKNPPRTRRSSTPEYLDSLQQIYPHIKRDSLVAHVRTQRRANRVTDDFASEDINMRNAEAGTILREWTVDGTIKARTGRIITPQFPLRTRLQNVDIGFTTDDITLRNTTIKSGKTSLTFTGKISGIRRAMSIGRGLAIDALIKADTLEANELLIAMQNGAAYAASSDEYKQALAKAQDEEELEQLIVAENEGRENAGGLIVVPSNVSVDIKLDVGYGKYADITIDRLTGSLVARDRVLQIKDIVARTNVGEIELTALYATRSKQDITFGADLDFKNIQVEKVIKIIPSIDTLVPMLASFRGFVSCQLAATANMDTNMNVNMPSLNAACRISGKEMVLLDGETFTEIAKMLNFRNKKENLVESISVEMLVRNSQIEIFPFIMQMDRYKVAVGGVHRLDMTFNYHVSVLESPLGFKMGINLAGNFDDMKFGIGKARYKDPNRQAYVTLIDDTRLNLRTQINSFLQQGADVARFTQFAAPKIDPSLLESNADSTLTLSAQDSLALYREGIIPEPPASLRDSLLQKRRRRVRH